MLDARDGATLRIIPVDRRRTETDEPHGVTVSADGRHWYATLGHGHPTLWKFETDGDRLVGRLQLDMAGAARVELTPDGGRAFIPDYWRGGLGEDSRVAVVDVHDLTVAALPLVCPAPHHAAVDPAGTRVAVTCSLSDEIVLMDAASAATLARVPAGPDPAAAGTPRYTPMNVAWSPDGARFFATMAGSGEVRAFSRAGEPEGAAAVGRMPAQIAGSADGRVLVVANRRGGSVSVLDPATLTEARRIELAGAAFPHGVALDPAGEVAYVTWEGGVGEPGGWRPCASARASCCGGARSACSLSGLRTFPAAGGVERERRGVDAVALSGGGWTVPEHVAEMGVARRAQHFGAAHEEAAVVLEADVGALGAVAEARPSRPRIVLVPRIEQRGLAAHAAIEPIVLQVPVGSGESPFGTLAAGDAKLLPGQALLPFTVAHAAFGLPFPAHDLYSPISDDAATKSP